MLLLVDEGRGPCSRIEGVRVKYLSSVEEGDSPTAKAVQKLWAVLRITSARFGRGSRWDGWLMVSAGCSSDGDVLEGYALDKT